MSKIEVNAIEPQCGTTLTVGASGDTITFPTGTTVVNNGTQTGFGRTGTVDWITTPKTATFTAVSGEGYFCNTSGGAFTVNLPAGVAGAIVSVADYAGTWQTNNITVAPNGTDKIGSTNGNATLDVEGQSVTFVFVDSTQGWINTMDSTSNVRGASFIVATGGTVTCSGDFKIHTFTGPGTFCVSNAGNTGGSNTVSYMVIAGSGGGGGTASGTAGGAGGGGAGGFRESKAATDTYTASPLNATSGPTYNLPVSVQGYSITVGGGGGGNSASPGTDGSNSIFSTITSTGGGGGGSRGPSDPDANGRSGGSGGGSGHGTTGSATPGGAGNTPPVSPPQGNAGQAFPSGPAAAGGGGGAGAASANANGGNGVTTSINATPTTRAGGGGGGNGAAAGSGGSGGGGAGNSSCGQIGGVGTINTGSGGGGSGSAGGSPNIAGGAGGSGIVIIRYKFQ